jgi:hypothetical protein
MADWQEMIEGNFQWELLVNAEIAAIWNYHQLLGLHSDTLFNVGKVIAKRALVPKMMTAAIAL